MISIHAPREGSDGLNSAAAQREYISIHAPREGSDSLDLTLTKIEQISIHAPREGSDPKGDPGEQGPKDFNPRSP